MENWVNYHCNKSDFEKTPGCSKASNMTSLNRNTRINAVSCTVFRTQNQGLIFGPRPEKSKWHTALVRARSVQQCQLDFRLLNSHPNVPSSRKRIESRRGSKFGWFNSTEKHLLRRLVCSSNLGVMGADLGVMGR